MVVVRESKVLLLGEKMGGGLPSGEGFQGKQVWGALVDMLIKKNISGAMFEKTLRWTGRRGKPEKVPWELL